MWRSGSRTASAQYRGRVSSVDELSVARHRSPLAEIEIGAVVDLYSRACVYALAPRVITSEKYSWPCVCAASSEKDIRHAV